MSKGKSICSCYEPPKIGVKFSSYSRSANMIDGSSSRNSSIISKLPLKKGTS